MTAGGGVDAKPRVRMPKSPRRGEKRQWVQCRKCRAVAYYDFVPYSLSSGIMTLGCGHSPIGSRDLGADNIPAEQAEPAYIEQVARRASALAALEQQS